MTVPDGSFSPAPPPKRGRALSPGQIAAGIALVLGLVFVFENTRTVPIRFLIPVVSAPLWFALLITFLLGGVTGFLISRRRITRE